MILTCENCNARFNLDENLIKESGSKVRCSKCHHIFTVYKSAPAEEPGPFLEPEEAPKEAPEFGLEEPEEIPVEEEISLEEVTLEEEPAVEEPAPVEEEMALEEAPEAEEEAFEEPPELDLEEPEEIPAEEEISLEELTFDEEPAVEEEIALEEVPEETPAEEIAEPVEEADEEALEAGLEGPEEEPIEEESAAEAPSVKAEVPPEEAEPEAEVRKEPEEELPEAVSEEPAEGPEEEVEEKPMPPPVVEKEPAWRRISTPVMIGLVLVLLAGGAFGAYALLRSFDVKIPFLESLTGAPESTFVEPGNLRITLVAHLIKGEFVENSAVGSLFVIKGKVRNDYPEARNFIMVKGVIYTKDGKPVQKKKIYCGNLLSDSDLQALDKATIDKKLRNKFGDERSNFKIPSGKVVPFVVVFSDLPQELGEFSVEVVSSAPA